MTLAPAVLLSAAAAVLAPDYAALIDQHRRAQDVPGIAAAVITGAAIEFAGGAGVADLETRDPVTDETTFYLGSVSKVITAVFVLGMAEDGHIALESDLGFRSDGAAITPVDILSHASGLPREGGFDYWFSARFPDRATLIGRARDAELVFPPGTGMHYSNIGYALVGQLSAQRLRTDFGAAIESRVFRPLGMDESGTDGPAPNMAAGYTPPGRLLPNSERPFAGVGDRMGDRHERQYHDAAAMAPAFGVYSSAADMARFGRFLVGRSGAGILSRRGRAALAEAQPSGWGLGMEPDRIDGRSVARHGGWFAAHRAHLLLDPSARIVVIVMANGDNADAAAIAEAIYRVARAAEPTSGLP